MNLTSEEIRIKIAESLGVEFVKWGKDWMLITAPCMIDPIRIKLNGRTLEEGKRDFVSALPNYPESLDACAEFEKTNWAEHKAYLRNLIDLCQTPEDAITATPLQRCLAYLKTKGIQ